MMQIRSLEEYQQAYRRSVEQPEAFWSDIASQFTWHEPWHTVLSYDFSGPQVRWCEGGKLNITENCLDRHIALRGNQTALLWEPNEPDQPSVSLSYSELLAEVSRCANALKEMAHLAGCSLLSRWSGCVSDESTPAAAVAGSRQSTCANVDRRGSA